MSRISLALLALLAAQGCSRAPAPGPEAAGALTPVPLPGGHPTLAPLPDPEANGGHVGRAPRRLTVAQLKESIRVTTGRQWSRIDELAASLGQADYAVSVSDATEPNLVFAKFLEDGAREVCVGAARDDLTRPAAERVLWPEVPGTATDFTLLDVGTVQKNLASLALRFWGSPLEAEELARWTETFRAIAARAKQANRPEQAWGGICIALMTDPRFITY